MNTFYKISFILCFVYSINVLAQFEDSEFHQITINEGLSQNTVLSIVQDSSGFIWFGTHDGLNRFDGYNIKQYYNKLYDENSLPGNEIKSLSVSENGDLLIGTVLGFAIMDTKKENFYRIPLNHNEIKQAQINGILEYDNNKFLLATEKGVAKIDEKLHTKTYFIYFDSVKTRNQVVNSIAKVNEDFFVATENGLGKIVGDRIEIQKILNPKENGKKILRINSIFTKDNKTLYLGAFSGIYKYDILQKTASKLSLNLSEKYSKNIHQFYLDKLGNTLVSSWEGLFYAKLDSEEFFKIEGHNDKKINNNSINCVLQSKDGIYWIGTSFGGVNYFDAKLKKFGHSELFDLSGRIVISFAENNEKIFVGTIGEGIYKFDKKDSTLQNITETSSKLKSNLIRSLAIQNDNLWIGYWNDNVTKLNLKTNKIVEYDSKQIFGVKNLSTSIRNFFVENDSIIWINSTKQGSTKMTGEKFETFSSSEGNLAGNKVSLTFSDLEKSIWIITEKGLNKFNRTTNSFDFVPLFEKGNEIQIKMISCFVDNQNNFWLGTYGNGLIKYNHGKKEFKNYTNEDGLPNNVIYSILESSENNLWLATNGGLSKFNIATENFENYDVNDGLQSNEFNHGASIKLKNGNLLFGGINGFNTIDEREIRRNNFVPNIVLTDFKILSKSREKPILKDNLKEEIIKLDYSQRDIYIEFASLNYTNSKKNKYAYKLLPINYEFINLDKSHSITFTNLKPGKYELQVIGSNNDNVWNYKPLIQKFQIIPPFYLTNWFRFLIIIIVLSILSYIAYQKIKSKIEIERLRLKIASDLHDDVGASLTNIAMHANMLNYVKDEIKQKARIEKLVNLSRDVITTMSDVVWSIDSRNDTARDLLDYMKNYAQTLANESEIELNFETTCSIQKKKIGINERQNIYLIFKEAFHNAIKYSGSDLIEIRIVVDNHSFYLEIIDNGNGLSEKKRKFGNGLRNMEMRAKRINANLEFINENGLTIKLKANI